MKQKDHRALANFLLDRAGRWSIWDHSRHRRAFILGCVSPDYIPTTYLRGFRKSRAMRGHNTPYSATHVYRTLDRLRLRGLRSLRDCYALGTLIHYLADSFTFVHNEDFEGDMRAHRAYEQSLHACFQSSLRSQPIRPIAAPSRALSEHLRAMRAAYGQAGKGYLCDCKAIIAACTAVFAAVCEGR